MLDRVLWSFDFNLSNRSRKMLLDVKKGGSACP